jgi:hypothetical protein
VLLPSWLGAQQPDTVTIPIKPIEVIGSIVGLVSGPSVRSSLAGTLTMTDADLRAWRPAFLPNALLGSSASVYDDLASPFKQSVVLRGFTVGPVVGMPQGVSVFIDGIPVNELGSGEVSFDLLPLDHVERIEVMPGTASLLGPNSLGGAINLITRRGGAAAGSLPPRSFELSLRRNFRR